MTTPPAARRTRHTAVLACTMLAVCGASLTAQQQTPAPTALLSGTPHYDVVLEVPELSVEEIELTVAGLRAQLALDALAANLVSVSAGAVVGIDRVELGIYGVLAEAYLYVDLDNVG
ncbi:MAG: hypothetical protein ACREK1_07415, partial [Longimicrobiales bacterium]